MARDRAKRTVRASARARAADLDIFRSSSVPASPASSPSPTPSGSKPMPRLIAREVMRMYCTLHDRIVSYKQHGEAGAPKKGRFHTVAAEYLLGLPDAALWNLSGKAGQAKLSNYLRNAEAKARNYALQQKDTANKELVKIDKTYDFWDVPEVRNHFLTSNEHRQAARQASLLAQNSVEVDDDILEIAPVISIADTTTVASSQIEQVAATETMMKRRTSLGGAVSAFESTLTPLVAALHKRVDSTSTLTEPDLNMRKTAIVVLQKNYYGAMRAKVLVRVAKGTHKGNAITCAVCALLDADVDSYEISAVVSDFVEHWKWDHDAASATSGSLM